MKASKEKVADAVRKAKRHIENPLTEAQKAKNVVAQQHSKIAKIIK
jgi:hypothetical protein